MFDALLQLGFIGPGGPELLVIMLVLIMMFGAKDAPRILRKLNEMLTQVRNTADGFKREVMYGDLNNDTPDYSSSDEDIYPSYDEHDDDYDYNADYSDETFNELDEELIEEREAESAKKEHGEEPTDSEGDDAQKT